jgi:predicted transcriptional regulator
MRTEYCLFGASLHKRRRMDMGLDMTCIDLSVEDLLGCSFGLSRREVGVLLRLLEAESWKPVSGLCRAVARDRSVVQRALHKLAGKGLVEREQHNLEGGGYEYLYRARDKVAVKRAILGRSRAFSRMVRETVGGW